jgi:signal transduction histidine kinase
VRDLSHLLHPAMLDDLGLVTALDSYTRSFGERYKLAVSFIHDQMIPRMIPDIEVAAYRIVQEALMNVVKHARARSCRVYLQRLAHTILLTVEDDGRGFDVQGFDTPGTGRGLGLLGIRERAAHLDGIALIESATGGGTRVTVELPARTRTAPAEPDRAAAPADAPVTLAWEAHHG